MHSNSKGLSTFVLGAVLSTFALAGTSASAVTVSGVSVQEGTGYTNVTVKATASAASTFVFAVKNHDGDVLKSVQQAVSEGENSCVIDLTDLVGSADKNKTYYYEVYELGGTSTNGAYYSNVGWQTNDFFKADATVDPAVYVKGQWSGTAPEISGNAFQISGTEYAFSVTNDVTVDADHEIVDFQCVANVDSCYLLDDITNDVTGAIGAISLVTNDESDVAATWMVLKGGTEWVAATGADAVTNNYNLRMEVDYAANSIRYSVKPTSADAWSILSVGGDEWVAATNDATSVSNVCFAGNSTVAKFGAKLSTKAIVEVGGNEYTNLDTALVASAGKAILLFTNLKISPVGMTAGDYTISKNGKTVETVDVPGVAPATEGGTVVFNDPTLTITSVKFVAEMSDGDFATAGNLRYGTLAEAASAVTNGATIFLIKDVAANTTFTKAGVAFTLDLNGHALAQSSNESPILTVTGDTVAMYLTGTEGGSITGATTTAISVVDGANVVIDGIWVTNNTTAVSAGNASEVVISNGVFNNAFVTSGDTPGKIKIRGGYIADDATFTGATDAEATGGKFTDKAGTPSLATGYALVAFAIPVVTNGYTFTQEVMTDISGEGSSKVWSVTNDNGEASIGGVQLPDAFVAKAAKAAGVSGESEVSVTQAMLNASAAYNGGKAKYWECYVLGITNLTSVTEGPYVKGVQDANSNKIGFSMLTPAAVKAAESGCKVEYQVEAYDNVGISGTAKETSEKVNYDKAAEINVPTDGKVRYYKLKVTISPKK